MKKIIVFLLVLLTAISLFGQGSFFDTSLYSPALEKEKMVRVYLPPDYAENLELQYPVIYFLHGLGGNHSSVKGPITLADSLITNGVIKPVILVAADNSCEPFGGSQYMNSILWGNYEDFMTTDLIAWVDSSFRTIPERNGRALMGQSMGGYGSFRYGILHKDKYRALAAHAGPVDFLDPIFLDSLHANVLKENQPGPPYFYEYENAGFWTKMTFVGWGAMTPNLNSHQKYVNPPIVEFPYDENGLVIDTLMPKARKDNIIYLIQQLAPVDSVGIMFGCGSQDRLMFYQMNVNLKNTLENLGLAYEFYDHDGGHGLPAGFIRQAFIYLDTIMQHPKSNTLPNRSINKD